MVDKIATDRTRDAADAPAGIGDRERAWTSRRVVRLLRNHALGPFVVVVALAAWQYASSAGLIDPFVFPSPARVVESIVALTQTGFPLGTTIWSHLVATASRVVRGYLLGSLTAIPIGIVIGRSRVLITAIESIVTLARSVAVISLLPMAVALYGAGELARTLLIAYAVFWVVLTSTIAAVQDIDPLLIRAARAYGAGRLALFRHVALPAALPRVFAGLKVALGLSFTVIIAVELIGTQRGLGALIAQAQRLFRTDMVMAGMVFIGVVGFLLARGLDALEARLLPWADTTAEQR